MIYLAPYNVTRGFIQNEIKKSLKLGRKLFYSIDPLESPSEIMRIKNMLISLGIDKKSFQEGKKMSNNKMFSSQNIMNAQMGREVNPYVYTFDFTIGEDGVPDKDA